MKSALITFVKTPILGKVKTRLQPFLSPDKIVDIYKSFVTETISNCASLKGIDKFLGCYPTMDNDFLKHLIKTYNLKSFLQRGNDLGEKIINAFNDYLKKGYTNVVIIGSDSPTLPKSYIEDAFIELKKNNFVIGPCCDGGIYLVGVRKQIIPEIFQDVPWDTSEVLNKTLKRLNLLDINFSMLPFWYDVDTVESLRFMETHRSYLNKKQRV